MDFFPHKDFSKFHTPLRTVNEQPWLAAFEPVTLIQFICLFPLFKFQLKFFGSASKYSIFYIHIFRKLFKMDYMDVKGSNKIGTHLISESYWT